MIIVFRIVGTLLASSVSLTPSHLDGEFTDALSALCHSSSRPCDDCGLLPVPCASSGEEVSEQSACLPPSLSCPLEPELRHVPSENMAQSSWTAPFPLRGVGTYSKASDITQAQDASLRLAGARPRKESDPGPCRIPYKHPVHAVPPLPSGTRRASTLSCNPRRAYGFGPACLDSFIHSLNIQVYREGVMKGGHIDENMLLTLALQVSPAWKAQRGVLANPMTTVSVCLHLYALPGKLHHTQFS